jgi:hypothetical protein
MVLKVQRQVNGEHMVSTFFDLGNGLSHRVTRRNVSRETFRDEVGELVSNSRSVRSRLIEVLESVDLPVRGDG